MVRRLLTLLLTCAVLPAATAADALARATPRIVGGHTATSTEVPWQVAIVDDTHFSGPEQFCGGTVLDATHVLTAAHCLDDPAQFSADRVYAGTTSLLTPVQDVAVVSSVRHPGYDAAKGLNDAAVLTLATPLTLDGTTTKAVELASVTPDTGTAVTVSGWGDFTGNGVYPTDLRAVTVHVVSDSTCASAYGPTIVPQRHLCAGEPVDGTDSCQGDSGGPLVLAGTNTLVGIVSFGNGCGLAAYPGVYAEVANPSIRAFITGALGATAPLTQDLADVVPEQPRPETPKAEEPAPAQPPAFRPLEDRSAPTVTLLSRACTKTACTLHLGALDAGGVAAVSASVRATYTTTCRKGRKRRSCKKTTTARTVVARDSGRGLFVLKVSKLPRKATVRFDVSATDRTGNRAALTVRKATR
ncbi:serine protease [Conexibacter sp. SYSU D00693]|uniref:S1 family serine peptidase n=1 Tax=Conexibacter sp. SYSU D00693 TaxID=2812560 RepID=UPI00196A5AB4|nr:serine protease [Conexibacter sp. SYSU D00693]